jgi:hypothetical protein
VSDESPIDFAGEHCDDSTRWTTMSPDINTAKRSGRATSYNDLRSLVFLDKDMVEDVQH